MPKKQIKFRGKTYKYRYTTGKPRPIAWYMDIRGNWQGRVIKPKTKSKRKTIYLQDWRKK